MADTLGAGSGDPWKLACVAVYGTTLVVLYVISTCCHSVRGRSKRIPQMLDHLSIYLLIAGSLQHFVAIMFYVV